MSLKLQAGNSQAANVTLKKIPRFLGEYMETQLENARKSSVSKCFKLEYVNILVRCVLDFGGN